MKIIIYKLFSSDKCYIGSTNSSLNKRISVHKSYYNKYIKNGNCPYYSSFEILKEPHYEYDILEEIEITDLNNIKYRYERERFYIDNEPNCFNKNLPNRDNKAMKHSYYLANRDVILEKYHSNKLLSK
jgi:hypothetical protein